MEKNNTSSSNSSVCNKIRHALSSNPAVRAIHRISSYHNPEEPKYVTYDYSSSISSSSSPSSPTNTIPIPIKTKVTKPQQFPQQHVKANKEESGSIPIKFVKGNKATSTTSVHGQGPKFPQPFVPNSEIATNKVATKGELPQQHGHGHHGHGHGHVHGQVPTFPQPSVPNSEMATTKVATKGELPQQHVHHGHGHGYGHGHGHGHEHGHGVHSEQQGKKSLMDINDTFHEYIKRAKDKIRTVSNIGRGQNTQDYESHDATNKEENHKDPFSDFIHRAKKKFRTTTIVGKTSSFRKG